MGSSNDRVSPPSAKNSEKSAVSTAATSRVDSKNLLGARGELIIDHGGREYRLRQTSTGKLILTA